MTAIAARARGLTTTIASADVLASIDRAGDAGELAAALARAELRVAGPLNADAIDRAASSRIARDLAALGRWSDAIAPLELDEDRRSLRALVRGLTSGAPTTSRLRAAIPTARLPAPALAALAALPTVEELTRALARLPHPLASALDRARSPVDPLDIELQLMRRFVELAHSRDGALRTYLAQLIDAENAGAALLLAARGAGIDVDRAFVAGGSRISRDLFAAASADSIDAARARLAVALARTPLAAALFQPAPAALEDAALAWQLQTQARLRRTEPLGLAAAIHAVLLRRNEARHLRRAAWRVAMGAA
jgi:vacuolar-type H+-ATPase subunit C/Vma6